MSIEIQKEKTQQSLDALVQGLETMKSQLSEKDLSDQKKESYKKIVETMLSKLSEKDQAFDSYKKTLEEQKNLTPELIDQIKQTVVEINIDQLQEGEIKKIEESVELLKKTGIDLQSLSQKVKETTDSKKIIEQKKKEMFETIKTKLKEHWYSSWAADGVYEYLMDTYIHKKESTRRKGILYGGIGMLMIGAFLPGKLEDIIKSIESGVVKKVKDLFDPAKAKENLVDAKNKIESMVSPEQIEHHKQKIFGKLKEKLEQGLGKKLDAQKFKAVFEERYGKNNVEAYIKDKVRAYSDGRNVNLLEIAIDGLISPIKSGFSLLSIMKNHGLITSSEVVFQGTKQTASMLWDNSIEFGIGAMGIAGKTMGMMMGTISLEQVRDYAKEHYQSLDGTEKALLFGMMYRHGGIFQKIATGMVAGVGHLTSLAFTQGSESMGKITAFKHGFMNTFDGQLKLLEELESVIGGTELKTSTLMKQTIKELYNHQLIYQYCHQAKDVDELKSLIQKTKSPELKKLFDDAFKTLDVSDQGNLKKISSAIGVEIRGQTEKISNNIRNKFDVGEKFLHKFNLAPQFSSMKHELALAEHIEHIGYVQKELLQKDELLHFAKKYFYKVELGKLGIQQVDIINTLKLHLKDVTEAKDFFNNIRTLATKSPEVATTLLKQFPVILVGGEVLSAINSPDHKDHGVISEILKGLGVLTPVVGPLMLLDEGLELGSEKPLDLTKAGLGAGLLTVDGFFAIEAVRAAKMVGNSGSGALIKYMANPLIESAQFVKSVTIDGTATLFKMTKDGIQVAKTEGLGALAAESINFFKGSGKVLGTYALIAGIGYLAYKQRVEVHGNEEDRKNLAEIEKDQSAFEQKIKKEWKSASLEQKSKLIKVALMHRMQLSDPDSLDVEYDESHKIVCRLHRLVQKSVLMQHQQELLEGLQNLNGELYTFAFTFSSRGVAHVKSEFEQQYGDKPENFISFLKEAGYTSQDIKTHFS